jgi:hypothetical protein
LSGTWNTTGIARGILLNVTDTASAATSRLLDLRYHGTTSFAIGKDGSWTFNSTANSGAGSGSLTPGNTPLFNLVQSTGLRSSLSPTTLTFFTAIGNTNPVLLTADAANTLAQRNGTNAQAYRLYNQFVDSANFERAFMRWNSNVLQIGTEAGGTGVNRGVQLAIGTQTPISFNPVGSGIDISGLRTASFSGGVVIGPGNVMTVGTQTYTAQSTDPTTSSIASGSWQVHRNTTSGTIRLWANNAGTLVSVALA